MPKRSIFRITTAGVISDYPDSQASAAYGITAGPDGAMWFSSFGNNTIGRISVVPSVAVSPTSGAPGQTVAVSGGGYSPGEQVNVKYETGLLSPNPSTVTMCSAIVNPDGTFACLGHIPHPSIAGLEGAHIIEAIGKTSLAIAKTTFTLT